MFGVIYLITNTKDGMQYVGQTIQVLKERWYKHIADSRKHESRYISRAINKYSPESFKVEVLHECETREEMDFVEIFYIALLNSKVPNGYNLVDGGGGVSGFKWAPGRKGHKDSAETRKKKSDSRKGIKYSEETLRRMSESHKGKTLSEENKKGISLSLLGRPSPMRGRHHTEEARVKISMALKRPRNSAHMPS